MRMKRLSFKLLLLCSVIAFTACDGQSDRTNTDEQAYVKDGNTYVRKVLTMDDIRNTMYEALTPAERIRVDSIVKTPDFKEYQEAVQTWTAKRVLYMNALSDEEFYSLKKENGLTDMEALSNRDSSIKEAFEEYDNAADRFYSKYGSLGRAYGVLCFAASEVGYEGPLPNRL